MPSVPLVVEMLLPELILVVGACFVLLLGLSRQWVRTTPLMSLFYIAGALIAAWRLKGVYVGDEAFAIAALNAGPLVWYVRLIVLGVGALIVLANRHVPEDSERGEFFSLVLFSLCGVSLVSIANNLVLLFLALELVSVPTYVLIGLSRRDIRAQEATGKYFFLGAFAAAMTLYGFSFLYGAAGTMTMFGGDSIVAWFGGQVLAGASPWTDPLVLLGLLLAIGGIAFKIAAAPLHFYVADVYQGAASPVTGLLGFVPKLAGFIAMMQVLALTAWHFGDAVFWMLWAMAAATMTVGNTLALMQNNVKRMLAYSSVAHSGYMLVALVAGPMQGLGGGTSPLRNGLTALLFYIAVYGVMNLGAFAALSFFRKPAKDDEDETAETLEELGGAARRHPWAALAMAICVLGLMGFPLTGGFFGKLYVFSAALSSEGLGATPHGAAMITLVIIAAINAAVAAAYYLRILAACYLGKPAANVSPVRCYALRGAIALCALFVLASFVRPAVLYQESLDAVQSVSAPCVSVSSQGFRAAATE